MFISIAQITVGVCFLAFMFDFLYSKYIVFTTSPEEAQELKGFARRYYRWAEKVTWLEFVVGYVIAALGLGSWLWRLLE